MQEQVQESSLAKRIKNLKFRPPLPQNEGKGKEVRTLIGLNWTNKEIVDKTGCTLHYVDNIRYRIKKETMKMVKKPKKVQILPNNKGKREAVIKLVEEGKSPAQIAGGLGCTNNYASLVAWGHRKEKRKKTEAAEQKHVTGKLTPNDKQVGGDHYKDNKIQVWDAIHDWGLGYFSGNVVKYVARHQKKNGVEDLKEARRYLDKLIAMSEKQGK